jgi:hypothetical protein
MGALAAAAMLAAPSAWAAKPAVFHVAHNVYGQPDLEGEWSNNSMTRLERPSGVTKLVLSEAEAKSSVPPDILPHNDSVGTGDTEGLDSFNLDWARLGGEIRSSWLIDPANGRLPYRPEVEARLRVRGPAADNPENRSIVERCLYMPQSGPPMLNGVYNNNFRFLQTRDTVAIFQEANHEARLIRIAAKGAPHEHTPAAATRWMGDAVGWYEGDTLVVETVNVTPSQSDRRSSTVRVVMSPQAKVTERFTRISAHQVRYEFVVDDPANFTQAWRGELPFTATTEAMFEYACHEGNYGLEGILAGAREEEKRASQAKN